MATPALSIVTTCKGRLEFLKQTLDPMIATGFPVTVVDYDCPQGTAAWVSARHSGVRVIKAVDRPIFNLSAARNLGAHGLKSDYILFLDSDTIPTEQFSRDLARLPLRDGIFVVAGNFELLGQALVPRRPFERIGGYDEIIEGWGYDDEDLYERLQDTGLIRQQFSGTSFRSLPHQDAQPALPSDKADKWASQRLNAIYSRLKRDVEVLRREQMTLEWRRKVRNAVESAIRRVEGGQGSQTVTISLPPITANASAPDARNGVYNLNRHIEFRIEIP